jgi:two-component system alkaline phosphatase synthesis response regulator PhoP
MRMSKILVIDDEPDIVYLIRLILEKEGYEVVEANSGTQGLKLAEKEKPDLILLDVMMPDMLGWEVCRRIKANEELKKVPVAMLTVKSAAEDKLKSLDEARADWHIAKPIDREKLLSTVEWLLKSPPRRT